jgi:hypothetical protein
MVTVDPWTFVLLLPSPRLFQLASSRRSSSTTSITSVPCQFACAFTPVCSQLTLLYSLASPPSGNAASALPVAPIQVTYDGESYVLMHSASVRQSRELVKPKENPADELESLSEEVVVPVPVLSESALDQESGLRSSSCEVGCVISDYTRDAHLNDSGYMQGVFGAK